MPEIWKPIPGYEDRYAISDLGRVKITGAGGRQSAAVIGRILVLGRSPNGCLHATLCRHGIKHSIDAHVLVAQAFIGERPDGATVNHKDGKKWHNVPDNLEYLTRSGNQRHALDVLGFQPRYGERHPHAKLTEEDIRHIRYLASNGVKQTAIAEAFNFSTGGICDIVHRKAWRHVP